MKILKYLSVAAVCLFGLTACVNDLDTTPIDKNSSTSFNQDAVFTKCYATLGLTGQKGPDGDCDIDDLDEGTSSFYRMMWELNEFPTDEGWWIWNDVGLADIRVMSWTNQNALVKGLYYRFNIDIKICNHFLANASTDEKGQKQRAEVRFLRALNYWYILDMFKYAPFSIEESTEYPKVYTRTQLYDWLVGELKELTTALPENRESIYRVDRTAAWLLLARTYLNAEVYTGTPHWADAKAAAEEALKNTKYELLQDNTVSKDGVTYTAYQKLFMGDNNKNGAQKEAVLLIFQDGLTCRCWGGSRFALNTFRDKNMTPCGSSDTWACFRSSPELVYKFFNENQAGGIGNVDEYNMWRKAGDDRAILCSGIDSTGFACKLNGTQSATFNDCWSVLKFTGVYSTSDSPAKSVGSDPAWPDTDIPLMRIAEAYMIIAEAAFRTGDKGTALTMINKLRDRAHAKNITSITEEALCDEWCREFYCEGRRRSDLIRFNRFAGPQADANAYNWEGRYGQNSGSNFFKSCEEKWNWYPIPYDDRSSNPNWTGVDDGY